MPTASSIVVMNCRRSLMKICGAAGVDVLINLKRCRVLDANATFIKMKNCRDDPSRHGFGFSADVEDVWKTV